MMNARDTGGVGVVGSKGGVGVGVGAGAIGGGKSVRALRKHLRYIVPQIRLVMVKEPGELIALVCPDDLARFVEPMRHYSEEHFVAFHLDARNQVTGYQIVSHGTVSSSLVHPREVFKAALLANSYSIIVAHNHPAGSLTPSKEDIETTEILIKAGNLLGVQVVDHVIVSSSGLHSMREYQGHLWRKAERS